MSKVACHTPVYLPWLGYFYKMSLVDHFIILDNTQIMKGGIANKNYILVQDSKHRLTVPFLGGSFQKFQDIRIANNTNWRKKHLQTLKQNYSKHPYFEEIASWLFPILDGNQKYLMDLNFQIIYQIAAYLAIDCEFQFASRIASEFDDATERLVGLTRACGGDTYISGFGGKDYMKFELFGVYGLKCIVYDFKYPTYEQFGNEQFVSKLSIVDLLFNCGSESGDIVRGCGS